MSIPTEYTLKQVTDKQLMSAIANFVLDGTDGSNTATLAEEILCTTVEYLGDSVWRIAATDTDNGLECSDTELAETIRTTSLMDEDIQEFVEQQTDHILIKKDDHWYTTMPTEAAPGLNVGDVLDSIDGSHYQWLKPAVDEETGEQRYLYLEDNGGWVNFSQMMWESEEEAKEAVEIGEWDLSIEDVEDCVLVQVTKRLAKHPFKA